MPTPDLIPDNSWTVTAKATHTGAAENPIPQHLIVWQLCHNGSPQVDMRGPAALRALNDMAHQYNTLRATPSRAVKCFADFPEKTRQNRMIKKSHS